MARIIVQTDKAPAAVGSYSQAVRIDNTVYISGQIPLAPDSSELVSDDFGEQARQVFKNLSAVAKAAEGDLSDAVKLTVYLTDLSDFALLNEVMAAHMDAPYPARAAVEVSALPKGALIEIDAILSLS